MRAAREAWFEAQLELGPDRLVFLNETATATNMARRNGWAPRGERCRLAAPHGHYKTSTVTAALRTSGLCAIALFDGPTNGTRFRSYVAETLTPVLQPGDIVVMDNLPAHKVAGVSEAIAAAGARLLYLPSYSPRCSVPAAAGTTGDRIETALSMAGFNHPPWGKGCLVYGGPTAASAGNSGADIPAAAATCRCPPRS